MVYTEQDETRLSGEYRFDTSMDAQNDEVGSFAPESHAQRKFKADHIFALSNSCQIPVKKGNRLPKDAHEAALLLVDENRAGGFEGEKEYRSPPPKHFIVEARARVDTNNKGARKMAYLQESPLTFVLKKGRVHSTFNYIVNNLYTYGGPLCQ